MISPLKQVPALRMELRWEISLWSFGSRASPSSAPCALDIPVEVPGESGHMLTRHVPYKDNPCKIPKIKHKRSKKKPFQTWYPFWPSIIPSKERNVEIHVTHGDQPSGWLSNQVVTWYIHPDSHGDGTSTMFRSRPNRKAMDFPLPCWIVVDSMPLSGSYSMCHQNLEAVVLCCSRNSRNCNSLMILGQNVQSMPTPCTTCVFTFSPLKVVISCDITGFLRIKKNASLKLNMTKKNTSDKNFTQSHLPSSSKLSFF